MVHPQKKKKVTPSMSKNVKTSNKSYEPIIPNKDKSVVEEESRSKGLELRNHSMHADNTENPTEAEKSATDKELRKFVASVLKEVNSDVLQDVQTSLAKEPSPDNDSGEKAEENVPKHVALERRKPLTNIVTLSIAKRLQRRKGKTVVFEDSPSREVKRKVGGLKGTPSRSSTGKYPDITPIKIPANKKSHDAMPKSIFDNASLHYMKNAERWKYVIQRRVALERELGKYALKCKEVMEPIEVVGLMITVTHFGPCYESLVKEFVVTIPDGCDDTKSADYGKVYMRGNVVTFSPTMINKFLGRTNVHQAELEVADDQVCKEITSKQVRHCPNKGKLFADIVMTSSQAPDPATSKKSVISQLKETCKESKDSIRSSTATKIKFKTLMKVMIKEEKKEVVQGGDGNEKTDNEDNAGKDDVNEEKEDEG
ncbi:uncharacterized protein LOC127135790 [Lathyrus oleraceus]|uniref:uncharacterized protein LOC127135790 n=1 Tax=Pisum sativum TaxID=3888 RepID=UPI0021D267F1|nr:uncharacterized protein LOC127135790 [Pisum sativum]